MTNGTQTGLIRTVDGWALASVTWREGKIARQKILAGPFTGPGAKRRAIQESGTNQVLRVAA